MLTAFSVLLRGMDAEKSTIKLFLILSTITLRYGWLLSGHTLQKITPCFGFKELRKFKKKLDLKMNYFHCAHSCIPVSRVSLKDLSFLNIM